MSNHELPPISHAGSPGDVARGLKLTGFSQSQDERTPPSLSAAAPVQESRPAVAAVSGPMTLGALSRALNESQEDTDGIAEEFSPGAFLKGSAPEAPRKSGASLAGAALNSTPHPF